MLTVAQLDAIMPHAGVRALQYVAPLAAAMERFTINTPARIAAFLAQIAHESGELRFVRELADGMGYEGRSSLGNTQSGDGPRFKGRGLIQLTGRANYAACSRGLFGDDRLLTSPELLEEPGNAALSAGWFWDTRNCNALADAGDFEALTRRINGGLNGLPSRIAFWERAKAALADEQAPAPVEDRPINPDVIGEQMDSPENTTDWIGIGAKVVTTAASFANPLLGMLVAAFSPLAQEKIRGALEKHTDNPEVAAAIAKNLMDVAQKVTGQPDPLQAVAAVRASVDLAKVAEASALDALDRIAPYLDKIHQYTKDEWAATTASQNEAARRYAGAVYDPAPVMVNRMFCIYIGVLIGVASLIGLQIWLSDDHKPMGELITLFVALAMLAGNKLGTMVDNRFGSSASSAAKDATIQQLSRVR